MEIKIKEQQSVIEQAEDVAARAWESTEYRQYDATIADITITDSGSPTSDSQVAENTAVAIAQTKIRPMVTARTLESLGYPIKYSRAVVHLKSTEPRVGVIRSGQTVIAYGFIKNTHLLPGQSSLTSPETGLTTQIDSSAPETIEIVRISSRRPSQIWQHTTNSH